MTQRGKNNKIDYFIVVVTVSFPSINRRIWYNSIYLTQKGCQTKSDAQRCQVFKQQQKNPRQTNNPNIIPNRNSKFCDSIAYNLIVHTFIVSRKCKAYSGTRNKMYISRAWLPAAVNLAKKIIIHCLIQISIRIKKKNK